MFDALPAVPPPSPAVPARVTYDVGVYRMDSARFSARGPSLSQKILQEAYRPEEWVGLSQAVTSSNGCDPFAGTNCFSRIEANHFKNFAARAQRESQDNALRPVYHPQFERGFFSDQVKAAGSRVVYRSFLGALSEHPKVKAVVEGRYETEFSLGQSSLGQVEPSSQGLAPLQRPVYRAQEVPGKGVTLVETLVIEPASSATPAVQVASHQDSDHSFGKSLARFMGVSKVPLTSFRARFERVNQGGLGSSLFDLKQIRMSIEESNQIVVADLSGVLRGAWNEVSGKVRVPVQKHSLSVSIAPLSAHRTYTYSYALTAQRDVSLSFEDATDSFTARYELGPARDKAVVVQANRKSSTYSMSLTKEI